MSQETRILDLFIAGAMEGYDSWDIVDGVCRAVYTALGDPWGYDVCCGPDMKDAWITLERANVWQGTSLEKLRRPDRLLIEAVVAELEENGIPQTEEEWEVFEEEWKPTRREIWVRGELKAF
jgi:hypothetical protein